MAVTQTTEPWPCLCGGWAYTRDQMMYMSTLLDPDGNPDGWTCYWASLMSPYSLYCIDEDDVLLDTEAWRCMGLKTPVHDADLGLLEWLDNPTMIGPL